MAEAWFGIGITHEAEGRYLEALSFMKRAIGLEDDDSEYWFSLGGVYYHLEYFEDAEKAYEKSTQLDPYSSEVWIDWSFVLVKQDKLDDAIELLENSIKYFDDCHQIHYRLASYYFLANKGTKGMEHLQTALTINAKDYELLFEHAPLLKNSAPIQTVINSFL